MTLLDSAALTAPARVVDTVKEMVRLFCAPCMSEDCVMLPNTRRQIGGVRVYDHVDL